MKRIMSLLFALVLAVSCMGVKMPVEAVGEEVTALQNGFTDVLFSNGYRGFCIDANKDGAYANDDKYKVSDGSSAFSNVDDKNISQSLKKLFVCCFEEIFEKNESGYLLKDTNIVQAVIWHYTDNRYIYGTQKEIWNKIEAIEDIEIPDDRYQIVTASGDIVTFHFAVMEPENTNTQCFFAYKLDVTPGSSSHPEEISVNGSMEWNDIDNPEGVRPEAITINLFADGEKVESKIVTASDEWKWEFANLSKYEDGAEIVYTISVEEMEGFTTEVEGYDVIATYISDTAVQPEYVNTTVSLIWDDESNNDGNRPGSVTAVLSNGAEVSLNEENNWTAVIENLPKNDSEGQEIAYTWAVTGISTGYTLLDTKIEGTTTTFTYEYALETISVNGSVEWNDVDNPELVRPELLTINLLADGEKVESKIITASDDWKWEFANLSKYEDGAEIVYTISVEEVEGFTTEVEGYDVIAAYISDIVEEPETTSATISLVWDDMENQDGKRPTSVEAVLSDGITVATLSEENNWTVMVEELPKTDEAGNDITYTWTVDELDGYMLTESVEGTETTVTCSHVPETIVLNGNIIWNDSDNQDNVRPDKVVIKLFANGEEIEIEVTADDWKWEYTNLPKYEAGEEIIYTLEELVIDEYVVEIDGYDVIATHEVIDSGNEGGGVPGEPEPPADPESPENPETPTDQEKPAEPGNSGESERENATPSTGDDSNVTYYLIMFVAACMAIIERTFAYRKQR